MITISMCKNLLINVEIICNNNDNEQVDRLLLTCLQSWKGKIEFRTCCTELLINMYKNLVN